MCVAKLFDINSQLVEDQGFLEMLKETLSDSNPMVSQHCMVTGSSTHSATLCDVACSGAQRFHHCCFARECSSLCVVYVTHPPVPPSLQVVANAVAALSEISETSQSAAALSSLDTPTINKLLTALNECTEWGQVFILDSVAQYSPKDDREAQRCGRGGVHVSRGHTAHVTCDVVVQCHCRHLSLLSAMCDTCHFALMQCG